MQYINKPERILILSILFFSYITILPTFGITDQSPTILEPRFFGSLSIIAMLHLIQLSYLQKYNTLGALVQIFIVGFIVYLRSSEIWQVAIILIFFVYSILRSRDFKKAIIPIALILTISSFGIIQSQLLNKQYITDTRAHVFWHALLVGLGNNPNIRQELNLSELTENDSVDIDAESAVRNHLLEMGRINLVDKIFSATPSLAENNTQYFPIINWRFYEIEAKNLYVKIFKSRPLDVIANYLWYQPSYYIDTIVFIYRASYEKAHIKNQEATLIATYNFTRDLYFQIYGYLIILVLVTFTLRLSPNSSNLGQLWSVYLFSLIPPFYVMAKMQYMQLSLSILITAIIYSLLFAFAKVRDVLNASFSET